MPPPRVLRSILELSELLQELRNTDATTGMQRRTDREIQQGYHT